MESSMPSPLLLAAAALLILAVGVVVVFVALRASRAGARTPPSAGAAAPAMAMPDAGLEHEPFDDEEAPTMVVQVPGDAPRPVPVRPTSPPTRSAGATIIAFDDDDDDGM
jgi:cytoskeletal protein RodZ